ncbi:MAG: nucleotidyltransferase domain-containing protein [Gammaproteobacteria bacterium]|nr:nucleotidyltransferase domain-containing protein [Gammaproteobacteria bacterium]
MRLSDHIRREIKLAAQCYFKQAPVYLFGSRRDDSRRGGDIDLYIETVMSDSEVAQAKIKMMAQLYRRIGERKIDIVVNNGGAALPIFQRARREGVPL